MACKCGAPTYEAHLKAEYPPHVYRGAVWVPPKEEEEE